MAKKEELIQPEKLAAIQYDYELGVKTKTKVAKKHSVDRGTIYNLANKYKWIYGKLKDYATKKKKVPTRPYKIKPKVEKKVSTKQLKVSTNNKKEEVSTKVAEKVSTNTPIKVSTKEKNKPSISNKYNGKYHPRLAFKFCLLGLTDQEIADVFKTKVASLIEWEEKHLEFNSAMQRGRDEADANVATRLYNRAIGYSHKEDKVFQYKGKPVIVPTTKYYPPDTSAAIFWLKNRHGDKWREKQEIETVNRILKTTLPHVEKSKDDADFKKAVEKENNE